MTDGSDAPRFAGDTSREALRVRFAALRRIPAWQRLALADDLTRLTQSLCRAGLRRRHPDLSEEELEARFFALALGRDLAARVLEHRRARQARSEP